MIKMDRIIRSAETVLEEAIDTYSRMKKDYKRFGQLLLEYQKLVPDGEFEKQVAISFPDISLRQLYRYMKLTREGKSLAEVTSRGTGVLLLGDSESVDVSSPRRLLSPEAVRPNKELARIEREIHTAVREKYRQWDQRSGVIRLYIKQFLTKEEPIGRDLTEAMSNIDKFDFQEDLNSLEEILIQLKELAKRAGELASELEASLRTKERRI